MQMQAAILTEAHSPFKIETVDIDLPKAGEVLVKMAATGVCHSDWHLVAGKAPFPAPIILGHEGAGIVEAVGVGVSRVKRGDHVTLNWKACCGDCFYCQQDQPAICDTHAADINAGLLADGTSRIRWHGQPIYILGGLGTFAEYAVVRQESVVPIRKDVPLAVAALVGCAVSTGVGAAIYTAEVRPGQSVAVFGAGGVGLNIIQGAALCGADPIIAVDTNSNKMEIARDFGATHCLMSDDTVVAEIQKLSGGRGADHCFESVGIPALQETAIAAVRPGGIVTLVGITPQDAGTTIFGQVITVSERKIRGSAYGSVNPARDFHMLLDLYQAGKLKLEQLVTQRYRLDEINEGYASMLTGDMARGVIVF
ncbi:MAG: Zn-dependent alcohol dehydrogenase [Chloroflexi bacterium]|nr:Zn-dependent alcohol dehydrogenase [Chloroflexota bacterium]